MANLPVPNPRTAVAGEFETAAMMNAFRDAINFLTNPPLAVLYQGSAQSIPNAAFTAVALDSTTVDTYGGHSNTTNNTRYVAQVAGWYEMIGSIGFAVNSAGNRDGAWYKNGAAVTGPGPGVVVASQGGGNATAVDVPTLRVYLVVGDYMELQVFQSSGAALNTITGQFGCSMSAQWIHA